MGRFVPEESAGTAVLGCTWCSTWCGLGSKTLLADVSAVGYSMVAERAVVRVVGRVMGVDVHLVTLVDRALVSFVRA